MNQFLAAAVSSETLLVFTVAAPLSVFLLIGLLWLLGITPTEKAVSRITAITFALATLSAVTLAWNMSRTGWRPVDVLLGDWFSVGSYHFTATLLADSVSLPMVILTSVLCGLIGSFSASYLHRESGFLRFFALLHLFAFGAGLAFAAGSFDILLVGWEFAGLTSVLLIAFFNERPEPVRSSLRVFALYKATDIGLLGGAFLLPHFIGDAAAHHLFHPDSGQALAMGAGPAALIGLLLVIAAMGKSAQAPFSGWLPRAMEGPTPSSAIFYGAISVHLGIFLLIRAEPILDLTPFLRVLAVLVGFLTAIHATLSGRVATDAKTSLSYAALTQLGVIFVEAALGFETLAVIHMIGHAVLRTLQFLRLPSMLHDYHQMHAAAGGHLPKSGRHYARLLPLGVRAWLYRLALDRCHLDVILHRAFTSPLMRVAHALTILDRGAPEQVVYRPQPNQISPEFVRNLDA